MVLQTTPPAMVCVMDAIAEAKAKQQLESLNAYCFLPDDQWITLVSNFIWRKGEKRIPSDLLFVADICDWIRLDGLRLDDLRLAFDRMCSVELMAEQDYGSPDKYTQLLAKVVKEQIAQRKKQEQDERQRRERQEYDARVQAEREADQLLGLPEKRFSLAEVFNNVGKKP